LDTADIADGDGDGAMASFAARPVMSRLARYIHITLLSRYALTAFGLGALLWMLDLLRRLEDGGIGVAVLVGQALAALLVVPEALIDLLPVITVLATAAGMGALQTRHELTVMRAAGVSLWRLTALAMVPALIISGAALLFLQWGAPALQQTPERMIGSSLAEQGLWHPQHGLWIQGDQETINVRQLELGVAPADITIYQFDAPGELARIIEARRARIQMDGRWTLESVSISEFESGQPVQRVHHDELSWQSMLTASQLSLLRRPPGSLSLSELWRYVDGLKQRGQDHAEYELLMWRRLVIPLACVAMVLAAMATAAVPLKRQVVSVRLALALALGLVFQILAEMTAYAGLVLDQPGVFSAVLPPAVLMGVAWWLLIKAR